MHLECRTLRLADGYAAEDVGLGLGLPLVVSYDLLEGHQAKLVDLADSVQSAQEDLVQVPVVEQVRLLVHNVVHDSICLQPKLNSLTMNPDGLGRPSIWESQEMTCIATSWGGGE